MFLHFVRFLTAVRLNNSGYRNYYCMSRFREAWLRLKELVKPSQREPRSWLKTGQPPQPQVDSTLFEDFKAWWLRARTRVFRLVAGLLALVDVAMGALLFSNVWYMNLILYAYLVPSFLILLHYLRLTRNEA